MNVFKILFNDLQKNIILGTNLILNNNITYFYNLYIILSFHVYDSHENIK